MSLLQRCGHAGCPSIQVEGFCPEHRRPSPWTRGREPRRWERLSLAIRAERPTCEVEGCERPSRAVHHVGTFMVRANLDVTEFK
jgi:hypothetical protein